MNNGKKLIGYRDHESNAVYSMKAIKDLYKTEYVATRSEDEDVMNFEQWLDEASGRNGVLEKVVIYL